MLTSLNLTNNQLGSEGGKALADALCKNTMLTSLNLNENQRMEKHYHMHFAKTPS